jgi:hypothetical protein
MVLDWSPQRKQGQSGSPLLALRPPIPKKRAAIDFLAQADEASLLAFQRQC